MSAVPQFDPVIHPPVRLQLAAALSKVSDMEFGRARDLLGVSDSVLSKHLAQMQEVGYVRLRKAPLGGRQRTWLVLTSQGRSALQNHIRALQDLAGIIG
ncbi:MarR family transcriptional regulator [Gluconobacter oxydans]|uniref:transcriptional regulator n=1 Tax=Gluconobacter thailandicus TaxID=257438 RepID=UPI0002997549|nr:transcriptional regulator [Gluconobacter thailandicus]AFW00556.1 transcriptional regulator [Gluconobacter oxydans H24]ANQ40728.1 MarR family transcriptional regulator [Gluconobacter oxydans]